MKRGARFFIFIPAIAFAVLFTACANEAEMLPVPNVLKEAQTAGPSSTADALYSPEVLSAPAPSEAAGASASPAQTAKASATFKPLPTKAEAPTPAPAQLEPAKTQSAVTAAGAPTHEGEDMILVPLTQAPAMFSLPMPSAAGTEVLGNRKAEVDVSNKRDGYIMIRYIGSTTKKLRVVITGPDKAAYTYVLNNKGDYEVYPLSCGNGKYSVNVYENISGSKYSTASTASFEVKLKDEFAPFLRPNQYVNYSNSSKAVKKAEELTKGKSGMLNKISAIYRFVTENIAYDKELADSISAKVVTEYLPDIDKVLSSGKGICFDYAALMTAMLRISGVPCKLVVGYAGGVYHAWISAYSDSDGWVDAVIYFDGKGWKLMDPTYAASGKGSSEVMQYIGDGNNYKAKYLY